MHNNEDVKELERLRKMGVDVYTDPADMSVYVEGNKILEDGEWNKKALLNCVAKSSRDMSLNLYYHEKMVFVDEIPVKILESNDILFASIAFADLDIFEIFEKCLAKCNTVEYNNSNIELIVSLRTEGVELYSNKISLKYDRYKNLRLVFKLPDVCESDIKLIDNNEGCWNDKNILKYFTKHRHYYHDLKIATYKEGISTPVNESPACLFEDSNIILTEFNVDRFLVHDSFKLNMIVKIFYAFNGFNPNDDMKREWVELFSKNIEIDFTKYIKGDKIAFIIPIDILEKSDKIIIL